LSYRGPMGPGFFYESRCKGDSMEEIDKIYLSRALKHLREAQNDIKRAKRDDPEITRVRIELERTVQHLALILAKSV